MALSPNRQRAAAYIVTALFALAYMGNGGEFCGLIETCPSRLSALIAMGVLTFMSATGLAALTALDKLPRVAEAGWAALTALLNTCGMAVVSSPRSYTVGSATASIFSQAALMPALLFSIVAEVAIVLGLFLAVSDDEFDTGAKTKLVDPPVAAAPPPQQHVPPPVPQPIPMQTMPPPGATVPPAVAAGAPPV